jgi:hypothetical protein
MIVLVILVGIGVLDEASKQVDASPLAACVVPLLVLWLCADYAIRVAARLYVRHRLLPHEASNPTPRKWRWAVAPVAALLVVSALMTAWPMRIRFHFSLSAFDQAVEDIRSGAKTNMGPQRIGLYHVKRIAPEPDGRIRFVTGTSIIDPVGFCYDPKVGHRGGLSVRLTPNWYATEW